MKVIAAIGNGLVSDLEAQSLEVTPISTVEQLAEATLPDEPSFVVIDESLPNAAELLVRLKALIDGLDRDRIPVVAIGEPVGVRCVPDARSAASPEAIVAVAKQIIMRRARLRRLFDQEAVLKVPTTPEAVESAGDLLDVLVAAAGYSEEDGVKLGSTLREAIGNAAEHGNKNDPQRTIHINYLRSSDRLIVVVTDEGPGFDTQAFLSRADAVSALEHTRSRRETEERPGGLGVFIMRQTCDEICFNETGNSIYLMKFLPNKQA